MKLHRVPPADVSYYPPGSRADNLRPGDVLLTSGTGVFSKLIRLGQSLEYGEDSRFYTHAAVVLESNGKLAEALEWGVEVEDVTKYDDKAYAVVRPNITHVDRLQMQDFAWSVVVNRRRYGYLTIASIVLYLLNRAQFPGVLVWLAALVLSLAGVTSLVTVPVLILAFVLHGSVFVSTPGTAICSAFAAETLSRAGAIWTRPTTHILPADIAKAYGVKRIEGEDHRG